MGLHNYAALAKEFFLDRQFLNLIASTIILFLTILIAWYLYHKQLAKRDLFEIPKFSKESKLSNFFNRVMYFLKYLLIFPAYSFVWFLIFSFLFFYSLLNLLFSLHSQQKSPLFFLERSLSAISSSFWKSCLASKSFSHFAQDVGIRQSS